MELTCVDEWNRFLWAMEVRYRKDSSIDKWRRRSVYEQFVYEQFFAAAGIGKICVRCGGVNKQWREVRLCWICENKMELYNN